MHWKKFKSKEEESPVGVGRYGRLKHAERKLTRLEEEMDSRIHLARKIKKERSFEISRLKRDLVASEEVMHYQRGELKRYKEKFEKERSCWMHQLE